VGVWDRIFDPVIERSSIALYREAAEVPASRNLFDGNFGIEEFESSGNVLALK
jgi:hypothetical protein